MGPQGSWNGPKDQCTTFPHFVFLTLAAEKPERRKVRFPLDARVHYFCTLLHTLLCNFTRDSDASISTGTIESLPTTSMIGPRGPSHSGPSIPGTGRRWVLGGTVPLDHHGPQGPWTLKDRIPHKFEDPQAPRTPGPFRCLLGQIPNQTCKHLGRPCGGSPLPPKAGCAQPGEEGTHAASFTRPSDGHPVLNKAPIPLDPTDNWGLRLQTPSVDPRAHTHTLARPGQARPGYATPGQNRPAWPCRPVVSPACPCTPFVPPVWPCKPFLLPSHVAMQSILAPQVATQASLPPPFLSITAFTMDSFKRWQIEDYLQRRREMQTGRSRTMFMSTSSGKRFPSWPCSIPPSWP